MKKWERSSGILLHITSLPSAHGIGDLGPEARRFADWLSDGKQSVWQMLPLTPTGFGDSPYQALSAFAGNPLLLSLDDLAQEGFLSAEDLQNPPRFAREEIDYELVKQWKLPLIQKASQSPTLQKDYLEEFNRWADANWFWLRDYSYFSALKQAYGEQPWMQWEPRFRHYDLQKLESVKEELSARVHTEVFAQFMFARQFGALKWHCHERGIRLMGDLPIYVAHDSADVWAHPEMFELDDVGRGKLIAGVPPDYFSATGQLWGNPIYNWQAHRESGFAWWIERMRSMLRQFDMIRIDHFRGFEAYWAVPGGEKTAQNGEWVKAPGLELFTALEAELGEMPVLAENLGVITPEVEALRTRFNFPGMTILQFAFGNDPQAPYFTPHNYTRDRVAYTGTHDNDTVMGWWTRHQPTATETIQDIDRQKEIARRYIRMTADETPNWAFIRTLMASVADTVIFPMQDVLGLGTESRMNYPGTSTGNWRWMLTPEQIRPDDAKRLWELADIYGRA